MGKWTSLAVEAEKPQKSPDHELTEPTKPPVDPLLSVLSVGGEANSWGEGWLPVADESRRERAYMMLEAHPAARYAVLVDADSDPVILTVAARGVGCREKRVAQAEYDPFSLLAMIERYSATMH